MPQLPNDTPDQPMPEISPEIEAMWREALTAGHHNKYAFLPSSPRCAVCHVPFGGIGGKIVAMMGYRPSRKNPNICNLCDDFLPPGGAEIEVAILFADVRGSTALGERLGPAAFAALLNRFYKAANSVIVSHDGLVDKLVGDEVMAMFVPAFNGPNYRSVAARAAEGLLRAVGYGGRGEAWLSVGAGVHAGPAFVGKVGGGGVHDYTALGDTVNTAARLQAQAAPGEVVMSEVVYQDVAGRYPNAERKVLALKGKEEPLPVRVLRVGR